MFGTEPDQFMKDLHDVVAWDKKQNSDCLLYGV